VRDASTTITDGRSLAYTDLGSSTGPVVFYFHGAPGSRLDMAVFESAFQELGVRVVSADRPGYGGSSPKAGRRMEDWPVDVAALADHIGVDRFAVLGVSSGAPYAVACAALLPDRVASVGVVCGATDFAWSGAWDGYPEHESVPMRIGDEVRAAEWCAGQYGPDGSGFLEAGLEGMASVDQAALADERLATALMTTVAEAFRQGVGGYAQDLVVQGRSWVFDPGAIVAPAWVLHGDADTDTPVAHAHHTAELIPGARLLIRPEHGHISILTRIPQLSVDLVSALP
jgi:pimeloyl-ACP methyl ester carboxylesterase